jgi:transcription-repair coupling factor (superfamily II helicase)
MSTELKHIFIHNPHCKKLTDQLNHGQKENYVSGISGAAISFLMSAVAHQTGKFQLIVAADKEKAAYLLNDLEMLISKEDVLFLPESYRRAYDTEETDNANVLMRTEALNAISENKASVIVTYPSAICEKVISQQEIQTRKLTLKSGELVDYDFIMDVLIEYDFDRDDFVYEPGQFAARGGIIDVFSFAHELPVRIEFSGKKVESIRSFNPDTQLSEQIFESIDILPNIERKDKKESRFSLLEFIPKDSIVWVYEEKKLLDILQHFYKKAEESFEKLSGEIKRQAPELLFLRAEEFKEQMITHTAVHWGPTQETANAIVFNTGAQPPFQKNFDLLLDELTNKKNQLYTSYIFSDQLKQIERIYSIFDELLKKRGIFDDAIHQEIFEPQFFSIHEGFIDHDLKIACYTDHQIFERYKRFSLKATFSKEQSITIKELTNLNPGDYITHIDHGIGQFGGLEAVVNDGKKQESVRLIFKDGDTVFVSIHSLHKISRYSSKDGKQPTLNKIGTATWQTIKAKTKKKVKELAFDLIKLYAKRKAEKGFAFSPDSYLQNELEASFIYEDTPDQYKATQDVKTDMERTYPMDRLICGDVGFGKTEVALRAAFKAVCDNKQVAVLVPTTVLALQHYKTFSKRLKDFPCNVDYLNRFKSTKQVKESLEKLEKGQTDIIIGTHKLVGKDIKFKDLGLLIIDEEQKFGVSTKDKLKTFKASVDTLTLTATPIPRTLQFSLMGARDLSIIRTPPPNRYPVVTELRGFNEELIRDAIMFETSRNGQVFFIHNRVQNIMDITGMVSRLCPGVKVKFAHGQMEGHQLEEIMLEFIEGDLDVLVSTSIVESGLDIPNANTIFINDAQNFGLSDLHQMRGRVGRSNKKAFCYLLTPPLITLTNEARRRLNALLEFSDLGSGFNIAMKDLDIRGAGDILGAEQSGFINEIGYETYQKILAEAIQELKQNEFKDLFTEELNASGHKWFDDCTIDTDLEVMIPQTYIDNIAERLSLYKTIDGFKTEYEIQKFRSELKDRFGAIPQQTEELFHAVRLRMKGEELGLEKITLKKNTLICYFISNKNSSYYQSEVFARVLQFLQKPASKVVEFKERNGKLTLTLKNMRTISDALKFLEMI